MTAKLVGHVACRCQSENSVWLHNYTLLTNFKMHLLRLSIIHVYLR